MLSTVDHSSRYAWQTITKIAGLHYRSEGCWHPGCLAPPKLSESWHPLWHPRCQAPRVLSTPPLVNEMGVSGTRGAWHPCFKKNGGGAKHPGCWAPPTLPFRGGARHPGCLKHPLYPLHPGGESVKLGHHKFVSRISITFVFPMKYNPE